MQDISRGQLGEQPNCPMAPGLSGLRRNGGDTYFGFRNLLDPLDFLVRHDVVVPDDVRAVPFVLLLEGGDEQLRHPVAMVIPTEEPLLPSGGLGNTEQQALNRVSPNPQSQTSWLQTLVSNPMSSSRSLPPHQTRKQATQFGWHEMICHKSCRGSPLPRIPHLTSPVAGCNS